jgi:hypothetical protein
MGSDLARHLIYDLPSKQIGYEIVKAYGITCCVLHYMDDKDIIYIEPIASKWTITAGVYSRGLITPSSIGEIYMKLVAVSHHLAARKQYKDMHISFRIAIGMPISGT